MQFKKFFEAGFVGDSLALIAGALLTLAFAPFDITLLAILSPAVLLALWLKVTAWRAFYRGWLFGLGLFSTGVSWVFISIHTFGNASALLSLVITAGFIFILAIFPACSGYFLTKYFPKNNDTKILCAFPAIWCFFEWVRSWMFTGFPWLTLGYSQVHQPLSGFAAIGSVAAVSLFILICSGLFINSIRYFNQKKKRGILYQHIFTFVMIWIIGAGLAQVKWTKPKGDPIQVSLVQGNIPQEIKWSPEQITPTLKTYLDLTAKHWDSKIIIWPEGAIPVPMQTFPEFIEIMNRGALHHDTTILTGIPIKAIDEAGYYNAVIAVGTGKGVYLKRRLVPFGEFIPLEKYLHKTLTFLDIPMSDFVTNKKHFEPFKIDGVLMSVFICYEIAYPEQVRDNNPDIGLTLIVSNDAWFGHSIAQAQHLQMAEMRAQELGRPILFVSNNGITAIISPAGRIEASIPPFVTDVLTAKVQPYNGVTPWQRVGSDVDILVWIALLVTAIRTRKNK